MLLRKMLRELRLHSGQFISIFLLSLLAIFLFTGVAGEVAGEVLVDHVVVEYQSVYGHSRPPSFDDM